MNPSVITCHYLTYLVHQSVRFCRDIEPAAFSNIAVEVSGFAFPNVPLSCEKTKEK